MGVELPSEACGPLGKRVPVCISDTFIDIAVLPDSPQLPGPADEDREFRAVPVVIGDTAAARGETSPEAPGGGPIKTRVPVLIETTIDL